MNDLEIALYAEARVRMDPIVPLRFQTFGVADDRAMIRIDVGLHEWLEIPYRDLLDSRGERFLGAVIHAGTLNDFMRRTRRAMVKVESQFRGIAEQLEKLEHGLCSFHTASGRKCRRPAIDAGT